MILVNHKIPKELEYKWIMYKKELLQGKEISQVIEFNIFFFHFTFTTCNNTNTKGSSTMHIE